MEDLGRERRRFGASRYRSSMRMQASSGRSDDPRCSQTPAFSAVASSMGRHAGGSTYGDWEDSSREYNFSSDERRPTEGPHTPDKYTSNFRPKASGQSISAPGSSFTSAVFSSSLAGVHDVVLGKVFVPPRQQDSFITKLEMKTKNNTLQNRGSGGTRTMMAYSTSSSSLEAASAPPPKKDISRPHLGTSGWVNSRAKPNVAPPKPRTRVTPTREKKTNTASERKSPPLVTNRYALRDRTPRTKFLFEDQPAPSMPLRSRLGKRKTNSEGSASKPIALDSDSDSDPEVQVDSSKDIVAEVLNDTRRNGAKRKREEKTTEIDLDEMAMNSMARIDNCDVTIGLFRCIADLIFQGDRMCMRNIRGKHDNKWVFKPYYLVSYEQLQDVRQYSVPIEVDADAESEIEEADRMEQLLGEASYLAFRWPLREKADQTAMKCFYDPTGSDVLKGYVVVRPSEDATGGELNDAVEVLRGHGDVPSINDKEQAKAHLQVLMNDPFTYQASRRSRRQKNAGADEESASESEDDDVDGGVEVLKYPLPPCTTDVVTIIRRDVSRLKPRRYLNDNIVDYYFKRMMVETFRDNELVQEKVLFLNSHFYTRLRAGKGPSAAIRMEAGYKNVSTWLARSNFFNRSIIFIPINKDLHWSLAVILNPGVAGTDLSDDEACSCVGILDPLGSYHRKQAIIRNLRAFMRMEWNRSQGRTGGDEVDSVPEYGVDRVLKLDVAAPQQENSYDCGVYVLKFAEVILKNCLEQGLLAQNNGVISKDVTDANLETLISSSAFSAEDITATRKQIRQYIDVDANEYQARKKEKTKTPKQ